MTRRLDGVVDVVGGLTCRTDDRHLPRAEQHVAAPGQGVSPE
ncbi:hypothetical protein AB0M11_04870 [Streptomyces sp. NPDC051987]